MLAAGGVVLVDLDQVERRVVHRNKKRRQKRAAGPEWARARAIRDELAQVVMVALAENAGQEATDPDAHLAANLLWRHGPWLSSGRTAPIGRNRIPGR
jgi:hypothetical protein